jgi:23S rRNA pseudouridine1911/1915/1917 synthase
MAVRQGGREARTLYEVVSTWKAPMVSRLRCTLETGRTHQIRVHLSAIGHPVVGDGTYGGARDSLVVPRPFLHATTLAFTHPRSGEPVRVDEPLPADLAGVLAALGPPEPPPH